MMMKMMMMMMMRMKMRMRMRTIMRMMRMLINLYQVDLNGQSHPLNISKL